MNRSAKMILLCVCVPLLAASGCSAVPYAPRDDLVAEYGEDETQARLERVVMMSPWYRQGGLRASADGFSVALITGPFAINYRDVVGVQIYSNANTFVMGPNDRILGKVLFNTEADAMEFADTLMSLAKAAEDRRRGRPHGRIIGRGPAPAASAPASGGRGSVQAMCPVCGASSSSPSSCTRCGATW